MTGCTFRRDSGASERAEKARLWEERVSRRDVDERVEKEKRDRMPNVRRLLK